MADEDLKARAAQARRELTEAIFEFVATSDGMTNVEVARGLGLQSQSPGGQKNHLSHSLLADLVRASRIVRVERDRKLLYVAS